MLALHGLHFEKDSNKSFINVRWHGILISSISPDCEDNEYIDAHELTEFNGIKNFESSIEVEQTKTFKAQDIEKLAVALNAISNYVLQLDKEWIGRDLKEFNSSTISVRR